MVVPLVERMMRLPVLRSTATAESKDEELAGAVTTSDDQKIRLPLPSERTRFELLVRESVGVPEVLFMIGASRFATHTTVCSGMPLYHMPRCRLPGAELDGEKNPKEN
jgi:hypothetical protein